MMFTFIWLFLLRVEASTFSIHSLSILLPLPKNPIEASLAIRPTSKEGILPKDHVDAFPALLPEVANDKVYFELLQVVAIRVDPCFIEGRGPVRCKRQIRLIWQPVDFASSIVFTHDASFHSFYEFTEDKWKEFINEWKEVPQAIETDLQVHPLIQLEGYSGYTWTQMREILLRNLDEEKLSRITSMNLMMGEQMWVFSIFDIKNRNRKEVLIPRIGRTKQGVIMGTGNVEEFTGSIRPHPSEEIELAAFVQNSDGMKKNEKEMKELIRRVFAFENPIKHNAGTLDCVTCHMAQNIRLWGQKHFTSWDWAEGFTDDKYPGPLAEEELRSNRFRLFGYFYNQPVISQRLRNESRETFRLMNLVSP